jgi:hypothetical protein
MTNDESRLRLANYLSHMLEAARLAREYVEDVVKADSSTTVKSSLPELERQLLPLVSQPMLATALLTALRAHYASYRANGC